MNNYNTKTGLDGDYITVWVRVGIIHSMYEINAIPKEDFLEKIARPVEKYEEYFERKYPWQLEEVKRRADPLARSKLDYLIGSYNALSLEERMKQETGEMYRVDCRKIINGEE